MDKPRGSATKKKSTIPTVPEKSTSSVSTQFLMNLDTLVAKAQQFSAAHGCDQQCSEASKMHVYTEWLKTDSVLYEEIILSGNVLESISSIQTLEELCTAFDVYADLHLLWRIRFSEKALNRFKDFPREKKERVMERLLNLAQGRLDMEHDNTLVAAGPMRHMIVFSTQLYREDFLVLALELNQIPIVQNQKLKGFDFHHFLRVVDFTNSVEKVQSSYKQYVNLMRDDPAKLIRPDNSPGSSGKIISFENSVEVLETHIYGPILIKKKVLSDGESAQYQFDQGLKRWTLNALSTRNRWEEMQVAKANAIVISELADPGSTKLFIQFLQSKVKSFPFQLSEEELDVIGTPGNVLAIGRSGTGKTLCGMLRLFASQALFRWRARQQDQASSDFFGLHIVFITASPTLTLEVKSSYDRLRANRLHVPTATLSKALHHTGANEEDLNIKSSMRLMTHEDFPMFSTLRPLVFAIVASLKQPFFQETEVGGSTAVQIGFHNELKGVRVISHHSKREELNEDYDYQTQSYQLYSKRLEEDLVTEEKSISKIGKKLKKEAGSLLDINNEIDFDRFDRLFWPTVRTTVCLSPELVWAEIAGKLKGSAASSTFVNGHLPKEMYMTQNNKSSLLTSVEKEMVWTTFLQYEKWKKEKRAYDFQDVVTHALKEIDLYGYEGAPVHFMVVDEVQDLTHATLLLLAKITEQHMFLSGDTAQTIAKGVSFRFRDLNTLFASHEGFKAQPPTKKQLRMNYRSHTMILNLANCVVRLIELLFPKTIDKLDRECSAIEGPVPIILMNPHLEDIANALVTGKRVGRGLIRFGGRQVLLVPDESARQRLPEILKGALCLTIYESKGLEFDDVILFEFFEHCGVEESEWRILRELLYEERSETPADIYSLTWKPRFLAQFESAKHAALCTALKMLYVAITRTKQKFIVYDSSPSSKPLLDYMISMGIVTCKVAEDSGLQINKSEVADSEEWKEDWRNEGITMMKLKIYSEAAKCFENAGESKLQMEAELLHKADVAARLMNAAEAILSEPKSTPAMKKQEKANLNEAKSLFNEVAPGFSEIGKTRYAAQCFSSGGKFIKAANLYRKMNAWSELGHCLFEAGEYNDAGKSFIKVNNFPSALQSFETGKLWLNCIGILSQMKQSHSLTNRLSLLRKYCEQALESEDAGFCVYQSSSDQPVSTDPVNAVSLSLSESKTLIHLYKTDDQALHVTLKTIAEVEQNMNKNYTYSYLSMENQQWLPSGEVIVPSLMYQSQQLIVQIGNVASLFQSEAVELQGNSDAKTLEPIQEVEQVIDILQLLGLHKLAFIVANSIRKGDSIKEYLEIVAVQVSSVHLIKASQRFGQQFEKYGKYWSGIAAMKVHQCLELIDSDLLLQIAHSEDSIYPGLVILGYWKKVVSLTMDPRLASAFGDFQHVKLNYLIEKELPKTMMRDSCTWTGHSTDPMECEVLLCILEETIAQANRFWQVTLKCAQVPAYKITFNKAFPRNQVLWDYIIRQDNLDKLENEILGLVYKLKSSVLDQKLQRDEFALADLFSFFMELMFSYHVQPTKEFLDTLSFEWFEEIILSCKLWLKVFDPNTSSKSYMRGFYSMLRASLAPFGIRVLSGDVMLSGLPIYTHLLVSSDCLFFSELMKRSVKMYPVDIEGNVFLAPISDVLAYLRLTLVRLLTEMVISRKLHYQQNKGTSAFPFRHQEQSNEQNRAKLAACVYGELSQLRLIQKMFPEEYRFVGRVGGDQLQVGNNSEILKLQMQIYELRGEEYAHDDPAFAEYLRKKNKAAIKDLEKQKKELLALNRELSSEETQESELSSFIASLPISVHNEMIWVYEHKIVLPKIAKMHLMAYITERMETFNPRSDIPKLRYLDSIARLCGCQPYLMSLIEEPRLNILLFPEEDYVAGNLAEVIQKHLAMITYPGRKQVALRQGLDIKEKFQIIQKCILWSLILTNEKLILPKLFALEITRSYECGRKRFLKKILKAVTSISITQSLHLLCDMIEALQTEDQCHAIAHTILLLAVSVIANTSWTSQLFSISQVVRRLFYCIQCSPLTSCNSDLLTIAQVPMDKLDELASRLRKSRYLSESVRAMAIDRDTSEEGRALRKTFSTESQTVELVKLTDEELQESEAPETVTDKQAWYEGRDLELVVLSDYLNPALSQMRVTAHRKKTEVASKVWGGMEQGNLIEEVLSWDPGEKIQSDSDQLLLCDFQRKVVHFDVFQEWKAQFYTTFNVLHDLSVALLSQIDVYHNKTLHGKQRMMVYSNIKLLIKTIVKFHHHLLRALISYRPNPSLETGPAEAVQLEKCVSESNQVIEHVSRTDLNCTVTSTEDELSRLLPVQNNSSTKWKLTKK